MKTTVAFSREVMLTLAGSSDAIGRLRDVSLEDFLAYACALVFRDLTQEERTRFLFTDDKSTWPRFGSQ